jgi:hypothetical protein
MKLAAAGLALASALAATIILAGGPAHASCAIPPIEIIWSYPADGASAVPTNARVFMLTHGGFYTGAVHVNGQAVEVDPQDTPFGWNPRLQPDTHYVVEARNLGPDSRTLTIRFTTGAGPVSGALPAPPVVDRTIPLSTRDLSRACASALYIGTCFDTGIPDHLVLETRSRPLFFVLAQQPSSVVPPSAPRSSAPQLPFTILWPGECGHPEVFSGGATCFGSYRVSAVGITGETVTADFNCEGSAQPPATSPTPPASDAGVARPAPASQDHTGTGCAVGQSERAPGLPGVLLLGLVTSLVRRRVIRNR